MIDTIALFISHVNTVTSLFQRLSLVLLKYCTKVYFYACLYKIVERKNVIEKIMLAQTDFVNKCFLWFCIALIAEAICAKECRYKKEYNSACLLFTWSLGYGFFTATLQVLLLNILADSSADLCFSSYIFSFTLAQ